MNLFATLTHWMRPPPPLAAPVRLALQRIAVTLGPAAAADSNFERRLHQPVSRALEYCDSLVAAVPGLVDIDRSAFASDPLVHALFASPGDIDAMLGRSLDLRDYLGDVAGDGDEHLYSMLAMRRHEKSTMGIELDGNTLRSDVPQTLLYFSDHTLVQPGADLEATRQRLNLTTFDSLLACFHDHLEAVRLERDKLRGDRAMESAHLSIMRGKNLGHEITVRTRQLAELDHRLQAVANSLSPRAVIDALAEFLGQPEESLRLEPIEVCVDRSGVIRDGHAVAAGQADVIGFPELVARDRRRHVVVLTRIRRKDALRAIAAAQDEQARFILI